MTDLLFDLGPKSDGNLLFGETATPSIPDRPVTVSATLPALVVNAHVSIAFPVRVAAVLPAATASVRAQYVSNAARPTASLTNSSWQAADVVAPARLQGRYQDAQPHEDGPVVSWHSRTPVRSETKPRWQMVDRLPNGATSRWQGGESRGSRGAGRWQQGLRRATSAGTRWQDGTRTAGTGLKGRWQDGWRDRRNMTAARWQEATRHTEASYTGEIALAAALRKMFGMRYQEAWPPRPGKSDLGGGTVTPGTPCYTPSAHLVFDAAWDGSHNLLFVCDNEDDSGGGEQPGASVVVPVKRVYVQLNSASLVTVTGGVLIPTFSMSLSLDVDSWTWSFSASVPMQAESTVVTTDELAVQATINGTAYRFIVESVSRDRAFGSMPALKLTGRGLSAYLDAPYATEQSFGNTTARTAQQLMADVLTINGVALDWEIEWGLTDWSVPAGVFSHQGTYITALNAIASAAGGYVQPVPSAQKLRVLHRYPEVPWNWSSVTPDFELPSAVTTREGIEWVTKPEYNRVFVSGTGHGVLGQYTRTGTAGDLQAATVTDALITHADAARQRGRVPIAESGKRTNVTLRLPVLSETGIIPPGKWVKYTDNGESRFGITRSVSVDVGLPEVWQTIMVETRT